MSTKRKFTAKLGQPAVKPSAKPASRETLDDAAAVVTTGGLSDRLPVNVTKKSVADSKPQSISSDDEEDEDESELDEVEDKAEDQPKHALKEFAAGQDEDTEMADPNAPLPDNEGEVGEPSFGDLVRASASEPIDVAAAFNESSPAAAPQNRLAAPSGASLATVLSQALKTNDKTLLESCLQTNDINTIRSTIQRLSSPLASHLLSQLAARLHRRPGRSASIMVWVQWTLVMHGGYLATQAELVKQLASLNKVIDQRARGLQGLLALKGKLDMLEAQGQLRRSMQNMRNGSDAEAEDEEAALYIEGEEEEDSEAEGENAVKVNGIKSGMPSFDEYLNADDGSDDDDNMPTTANGLRDDDDDDDDDSDNENMIDDEASESENESLDEDEVDYDDADSVDEEDESDDAAPARAAPPSKLQKKGGLFSKVR